MDDGKSTHPSGLHPQTRSDVLSFPGSCCGDRFFLVLPPIPIDPPQQREGRCVFLKMAFFDGATNESVVDVLRTAGLKADKGPCAKTDTAEQLWRVKEDEFVFTKAQLTRDGGDHTPWTEFQIAFNLPPNTRDFAPPSSIDSKLQPRPWGSKGAGANPGRACLLCEAASIRRPGAKDRSVAIQASRCYERGQRQHAQDGGELNDGLPCSYWCGWIAGEYFHP